MAMTPRQLAIRAHFLDRDEKAADARMFTAMKFAFGGDEKTTKDWLNSLDVE